MLPQKKQTVFQCAMCGECCTSVSIPIEKDKAAALKERDWVRERFAETGLDFLPYDPDHYELPMTDTAECVFLGEDRRCMIHAREGEALKPKECIRFPFAAVRYNGGLAYDCSSSCRTVANKLLTEFSEIVPSPTHHPVPNEEPFPEKIPVSRLKKIDGAAYERYCETITRIFSEPGISPDLALKRTAAVIRALPGKLPHDLKHPAHLPEDFRLSGWREKLVLYWSLRRPYGIINRWAVLTEGDYCDPKVFGKDPVSLKGHGSVLWDAGELDPMLNGFLHSLLRRKVMLSYNHTLEGILLLTLSACLIVRWYARTLALIQGNNEVSRGDLSMAIRLTERYYTGHQPHFLEFFRLVPGLGLPVLLLLGR